MRLRKDEDLRVLALKTLGTFKLDAYVLLPFVRCVPSFRFFFKIDSCVDSFGDSVFCGVFRVIRYAIVSSAIARQILLRRFLRLVALAKFSFRLYFVCACVCICFLPLCRSVHVMSRINEGCATRRLARLSSPAVCLVRLFEVDGCVVFCPAVFGGWKGNSRPSRLRS